MRPSSADRRQFLHTLAGGAAASLVPNAVPVTASETAEREFHLAEGLTYLNTGTIGPCRRATLEATQRAWATLETNPVAHYGRFAGEALLE